MDSTLVIKVKYGDTLRRFSAHVNENKQLSLDMVGLRAKICSLFNFAADANLILRYVDEDGDLVTLVDDNDLHDMMRQQLPFLRIDVHVSNDIGGGKSNTSSSGNATPLRSPRVPDPSLSGNVAIADVWKSVQEPLNDALSNLCLVSKAVSSASPLLANLADTISKVGKPILNSHFQPNVTAGPSSKNGAPEESGTSEADGPKPTYMNPTFSDFISKTGKPHSYSQHQPPVTSGPTSENRVPGEQARGPQFVYGDSTSGSPFHAFADFISKVGKHVPNSHYQWPHVVAGIPGEHVTPEQSGPQSTYVGSTSSGTQPLVAGNPVGGEMDRVAVVDLNIPPSIPYSSQSANVNGDGKMGKVPTNDSFAHKGKISGTHKGKISGTSSSSTAPNNSSSWTSSTAPSLGNLRAHPFKRSHSQVMAPSGMFHKGVSCDGCGIYPIIGPRFKSNVKENYDLCSICFNTMGNATDYRRIDRRHPGFFPTLPHTLKLAKPKLDSRFILDVNVIDGTMMAPSTAFTKIWRIRNNGNLVWPMGTQLVWIGGDNFSDSHSVYLEVPMEGVPVEKELDIAVDFVAPQLPGRYISYWRMAAPSGQKFGQRVWVLIQVDASLKDSFYDSSQGLNLNIPLDVSGSKRPQIIDINVQPTEDDAFLQPHIPNAPTEPVNEIVDDQLMMQKLVDDFMLVNDLNESPVAVAASAPTISVAASAPTISVASPPTISVAASAPTTSVAATSLPTTYVAPSSVSYPIIDLSDTNPVVLSNQQSAAVNVPSSSFGVGGNNSVEETLLKELEVMGFKQVDLNKEILRMNEYNLEQSVDDLCGVSEWDPILQELHEMVRIPQQ
ncbi:PREDICTED: protein NBR1 homolog isoform X2 [Lupinus angustifolius]|uniref:protein NBR1 homolog isoform X2 n=1 Tax=Lupinus angustifolius TaxID=3871 RepID=UPI00092E35C3|nr:PREDICTED: protein NBR1 homolog isoform X2 [Lupinus angustifolius]